MTMDYQTGEDGPVLTEEQADAIDTIVDLLAPVLTHHQGMMANQREQRFRAALERLVAR